MTRTVTVTANTNEVVGDETFEVWLKHESDAWGLVATGAVEYVATTQDFILTGLIEGDTYIMQVRMKRAGRYRVGYLSPDPGTWPSQSRLEITGGALIGVDAPTITDVVGWERTSESAHQISFEVTPDDLTKDLQIRRNGVTIDTIVAPHAGPVLYVDTNPPLAVSHSYTARHVAGTLGGPSSAAEIIYAGPLAPTAITIGEDVGHLEHYDVAWTHAVYSGTGTKQYEAKVDESAASVTVSGTFANPIGVCPTALTDIRAYVRTKITNGSTVDYSLWGESAATIPPNC